MIGASRLEALDNEISSMRKSMSETSIRRRIRQERNDKIPESNDSDSTLTNAQERIEQSKKSSTLASLAMKVNQNLRIDSLYQSVSKLQGSIIESRKEVRSLEFKLGETPVTIRNLPDILNTSLHGRVREINKKMEKKMQEALETMELKLTKLTQELQLVVAKQNEEKKDDDNDGNNDDNDNQNVDFAAHKKKRKKKIKKDTKLRRRQRTPASSDDDNKEDYGDEEEFHDKRKNSRRGNSNSPPPHKEMSFVEKLVQTSHHQHEEEEKEEEEEEEEDEEERKEREKQEARVHEERKQEEKKARDLLSAEIMAQVKDLIQNELNTVNRNFDLVNLAAREISTRLEKHEGGGAFSSSTKGISTRERRRKEVLEEESKIPPAPWEQPKKDLSQSSSSSKERKSGSSSSKNGKKTKSSSSSASSAAAVVAAMAAAAEATAAETQKMLRQQQLEHMEKQANAERKYESLLDEMQALRIRVEQLEHNATVRPPAVPTSAVLTAAVPTSAVPTAAVPTSAVPTAAVPTAAVPAVTISYSVAESSMKHFNVPLSGTTTAAPADGDHESNPLSDSVTPALDLTAATTTTTTTTTTATPPSPNSLSSVSATHINLNSTQQQSEEILFDSTDSAVVVENQELTPRFPGVPKFTTSPFSFGGDVVVGTVYPDVTPEQRRLQLLESSIRERKTAITEQMEVDVAMARQTHLEMARLWRKLTTDVQLCSEEMRMLQQQQVTQREMIVISTVTARDAKKVAHDALHRVDDFETEQLEMLREQNQKYRRQLTDAKHTTKSYTDSIVDELCEDIDSSIDGMWSNGVEGKRNLSSSSSSSSSSRGSSSRGSMGAKVRMKHGATSKRKNKSRKRNRNSHQLGFDYGGPNPDPWKVEFSGTSMSEHEHDIITLPNVQLSPQYRKE